MDEQQHPAETAAVTPADPTGESARLDKALEETRVQTILLEQQVAGRLAESDAGIFHTHLMVLEDRGFLDKLRREVTRGHGAATAVRVAVAEYLEAFGRMEDPYLRERAADIRDIGRRIIAHLAGRGTPDPALAAEGILVAAEMLPSDMAALDPARVRGIVTERGEPTSHAAIMARSLGIPALMGVKGALRAINAGRPAHPRRQLRVRLHQPRRGRRGRVPPPRGGAPPRERPARRAARAAGGQPGRRAR